MKKIQLEGARKYIQGYPPYQQKVQSYPIEFDGEDALMPLEKYEKDEKLRQTFKDFKKHIIE